MEDRRVIEGFVWRDPSTGSVRRVDPRDVEIVVAWGPGDRRMWAVPTHILVGDGGSSPRRAGLGRLRRSVAAVRGVVGRVVTGGRLRAAVVAVAVVAPYLVLVLAGSFR